VKKKKIPIVETLAKPKPLTTRTAKLLRDEGHAWYHVLRYDWIYLVMLVTGLVLSIFFFGNLCPLKL